MDRQKIIKSIVKALKKQPVRLAYLHGSFATGKVRRGKDIDIAVVLEPDSEKADYVIASEVHSEAIGLGLPEVDIRKIDLNSSLVFLRNVLKEGRPIYVKNEKERIEFEIRVMKKFYDSQHLRQFMTRHVYESIKQNSYGNRQAYN